MTRSWAAFTSDFKEMIVRRIPAIATKGPHSKDDLPWHAFRSGRDGADRLRRLSRSI